MVSGTASLTWFLTEYPRFHLDSVCREFMLSFTQHLLLSVAWPTVVCGVDDGGVSHGVPLFSLAGAEKGRGVHRRIHGDHEARAVARPPRHAGLPSQSRGRPHDEAAP